MLNPTQPVVVLNVTGEATADEVLSVVREVREIIEEKTGLHLLHRTGIDRVYGRGVEGYGFNEEEIARYIV